METNIIIIIIVASVVALSLIVAGFMYVRRRRKNNLNQSEEDVIGQSNLNESKTSNKDKQVVNISNNSQNTQNENENENNNKEVYTSFKEIEVNQRIVDLLITRGVTKNNENHNIICAWAIFDTIIVKILCDGYNGLFYINELIECFDIIYKEVCSTGLEIAFWKHFYSYHLNDIDATIRSELFVHRDFNIKLDASIFQGFILMLRKIEKLNGIADKLEKMEIKIISRYDQRKCANEMMLKLSQMSDLKNNKNEIEIEGLIMENLQKLENNEKNCSEQQCVALRSNELSHIQAEFCVRALRSTLYEWKFE